MSAPHLAFVLAAGQSKRMRSKTPKVLHPCAGKALLRWSVDAAIAAGARPVVVLSPEAERETRAILPPGTAVALQEDMRGSGDAVRAARAAVTDKGGQAGVSHADSP